MIGPFDRLRDREFVGPFDRLRDREVVGPFDRLRDRVFLWVLRQAQGLSCHWVSSTVSLERNG